MDIKIGDKIRVCGKYFLSIPVVNTDTNAYTHWLIPGETYEVVSSAAARADIGNNFGWEDNYVYLKGLYRKVFGENARSIKDIFWMFRQQVEVQIGRGRLELLDQREELVNDFKEKLEIAREAYKKIEELDGKDD